MRNVIIGTAGHVDHGKTCLIRALSGVDTDRLMEEKKRGITIELGFANLPNDAGYRIGIIDVPGHEKFVKNMLAGIGGIDLVLMIIALDEGVMPQTKEHFEILKTLQIQKGILVFTKSDLVDEEFAEIVEEDAKDLIQGSFLEDAPSIRVSSATGENIDQLKQMILEELQNMDERRNEEELFRLPIDRVFTMQGFGTVVTGTLIEGSCHVGEDVILYPQERTIRIRGIQNHNEAEEEATSGQRTALNLTGIHKEEIERGEILASPGSMLVSSLADVKVSLFSDTKRRLKNQDHVHVSFGSSQKRARVVLLSKDALEAGQCDYAQLIFDEPVAVKYGDYFIIRFFSPIESFGGGRFLAVAPRKHRRKQEDLLESLSIKENGTRTEAMEEEMKSLGASFPNLKELAVRMNLTRKEAEKVLDKLKKEGKVLIAGSDGYIHKSYWDTIVSFTEQELSAFHEQNSILEGMEKAEFENRLGHRMHIPEKMRDDLLKELEKRKVIRTSASSVALAKFSNSYSGEQEKIRNQILSTYQQAGIEVPSNEELLSSLSDRKLGKQILADLAKQGELIKVNNANYMTASAWNDAVEKLKAKIETDGELTLGTYRDLMGTSRKYAIMLLEAFDQKKITKVVGEGRVLTGK